MTTFAAIAADYASAITEAVRREYPHGWRHHAAGPVQLRPREQHPAFYGCYDWHSAVHMHWSVVRLLREAPDELDADLVRAVLDDHLTPANLAVEVGYLAGDPTWERPYGWGWALTLADELAGWDDPDARRWGAALAPLADLLTDRFVVWLPTMDRPVRAGMHLNSAFGVSRALPWARRLAASGEPELLDAITAAAQRWFGADAGYANRWEPDAWDFLAPGLAEIDLMAELLPASRFGDWLDVFLPDSALDAWEHPLGAGDRSDGQVAHRDGLNLHRAYALTRLATRLGPADPRSAAMLRAADEHAGAGLAHVLGGDYMSEHWLASFAILLFDARTGVAR
ncbi:MAG: DUF2891 domain-containing protein [Actinobacteria bacterium]|nr:DUF2891 domain-containing protein [Actinomycetota bacterium]